MKESYSTPTPETCFWLDYLQDAEPSEVLSTYRDLHGKATDALGRLLCSSYEAAIALLPQDCQDEPQVATRVYQTFGCQGNPAEQTYILTQLVNLMPFDKLGASNILRRVIRQAPEDELILCETAAGMLDIAMKSGNWVSDPEDATDFTLQRIIRRVAA